MITDHAAGAGALLLTTFAAACSAAPPTGPAEPVPPLATAAASAVASAASPPVATAAPAPVAELPAPPEGLTRRYYRIHPPGDKDPLGGVPIAITVPPEWGVELDGLKDPSFAPCRVESPVFGKLSLVSLACGSEPDIAACMDRVVSFQYSKDELAAAKVEAQGPLRRWISLDRRVRDREQIHARLFAIDEASRTAVMCVMLLDGKDRAFFPDYKKACESLVLRPPGQHDEPPAAVTARPRAADGGGSAPLPEPPNAKAASEAALGFIAALQARDAKAAGKWVAMEGDCVEGTAKDRSACREYVRLMRSHLGDALFDSVPKDFQPGAVDVKAVPEAPGVLSVRVHPKGNECAEGQGLMVREMNKKLVVLFAVAVAAKEEGHARKKK